VRGVSTVPEITKTGGDDARDTLERVGWRELVRRSATRFLRADGTSHSRALGHASVLTAIPAVIMVIAATTAFHLETFRALLERTMESLAPGRAEELLRESFRQAAATTSSRWLTFALALVVTFVGGMFAMAQFERGCNRIYGVQDRRPGGRRFGRALLLSLTAGTLLWLAFILIALGGAVADALARSTDLSSGWSTAFNVARWPMGLALVFVGLTLMYRWAPNRHQPHPAWLQSATVVATLLWTAFTALLALYYAISQSVGDLYGPLVGFVAVLTWAYATGLALYVGAAFAAELEAAEAGRSRSGTR
jgi:YihY family inner membrane protein